MVISIEKIKKIENIDSKIVDVLSIIAKNGELSFSECIKILNALSFSNWEAFEKSVLDSTDASNVTNVPPIADDKSNETILPENNNISAYTKTGTPRKYKGYTKKEDAIQRIADYINKHDVYTILDIANEVGVSPTTVRTHIGNIDPDYRKHIVKNGTIYKGYTKKEDAIQRIADYVNKHDVYTISDIANEVGASPTTVRKYIGNIDPDYRKHIVKYGTTDSDIIKRVKEYIDNHEGCTKIEIITNCHISFNTLNRLLPSIEGSSINERSRRDGKVIEDMIRNYIKKNGSYRINEMCLDLNLSYTVVKKYLKVIDPGEKHRKKSRKTIDTYRDSIFNYITLNTKERTREKWLNDYVAKKSDTLDKSKGKLLKPLYDKLSYNYGIDFVQLSKDFLYEHDFTPIIDYPDVTAFELIILDEKLFNASKNILTSMYGV